MAGFTKRTAVFAVLAGLSTAAGSMPAVGQGEATPPIVEAITLPEGYAVSGVEVGAIQVSPAYNPGAEVATTPEQNDGEVSDPLEAFTESVIGDDGRRPVTSTTTYPASAIGQIEGTDNSVGGFICTGFLIDSNTILTAGHCVYPSAENRVETLEFFPGRNGATDPFGSCFVTRVFSPRLWIAEQNEYHDWAVGQLNCDIGDTVGWLGVFSLPGKTALRNIPARVQGYPGDKPPGTVWGMGNKILTSQKRMAFYSIDTSGGQSGSPVYQPIRPACGNGPCAMAIHAYGVHGGGPHSARNHAPRITDSRFGRIFDIADNNG